MTKDTLGETDINRQNKPTEWELQVFREDMRTMRDILAFPTTRRYVIMYLTRYHLSEVHELLDCRQAGGGE